MVGTLVNQNNPPEQSRIVVRVGLCFMIALLIHGVSLFFLPANIPARRDFVVTKIRLVAPAVVAPTVVSPATSTAKSTRSRQKSPPLPSEVVVTPEYGFGKLGYTKLLPNDVAALKGGGQLGSVDAPLGSKLAPEFQSHTAIIASEIDVPLFWRQTATASMASADLVLKDDNTIWCRLLVGTPILRAVLWKYLARPAVKAELASIFRLTGKKDYRIVLRFIPEPGSERTINFTDGSTAYAMGVEIVKTLPSPVHQFGGAEVSDAHSRKAKRRDRLALSALYESPAFNQQIRDAKL